MRLTSSPSVSDSHLAVYTNIDGSAIGLGVLIRIIPSLLRPLPRLQTFCCFCVRRNIFLSRLLRGIPDPLWFPFLSSIYWNFSTVYPLGPHSFVRDRASLSASGPSLSGSRQGPHLSSWLHFWAFSIEASASGYHEGFFLVGASRGQEGGRASGSLLSRCVAWSWPLPGLFTRVHG